jgi:hypothetical protein
MKSGLSVMVLLISFYMAGTASGRNDRTTGSMIYALEGASSVKVEGLSYSFSVVPNPTGDNVRLCIVEGGPETLKYQLYDITGMMKQENKLSGMETLIQMGNLARSLYFLKIKKDNFTVILLKIIKY